MKSQIQHFNPPISTGKTRSFDDTLIYFDKRGIGKPLVFCYGISCSIQSWKYQTEYFKKTHQTICFDYRGHNHSDVPKNLSNMTIDACAKDLLTILDEHQIQKSVFLGWSMGVNVILKLYELAPKRIHASVLLCGNPSNPFDVLDNSVVIPLLFELIKRAHNKIPKTTESLWNKILSNKIGHIAANRIGFNPDLANPKDIEIYLRGLSNMHLESLIHLMSNYIHTDQTHLLSSIKTPVLIVSGERDNLLPINAQKKMAELIKNSEYMKVPLGSHCCQLEMPDLVNLRIEKFLRDINWISAATA